MMLTRKKNIIAMARFGGNTAMFLRLMHKCRLCLHISIFMMLITKESNLYINTYMVENTWMMIDIYS